MSRIWQYQDLSMGGCSYNSHSALFCVTFGWVRSKSFTKTFWALSLSTVRLAWATYQPKQLVVKVLWVFDIIQSYKVIYIPTVDGRYPAPPGMSKTL